MHRRGFLLALLGFPLVAGAASKDKRCRWLRAKIEHLDSRLRAGQAPPQARRLRARRRRLRQQRFRECR